MPRRASTARFEWSTSVTNITRSASFIAERPERQLAVARLVAEQRPPAAVRVALPVVVRVALPVVVQPQAVGVAVERRQYRAANEPARRRPPADRAAFHTTCRPRAI